MMIFDPMTITVSPVALPYKFVLPVTAKVPLLAVGIEAVAQDKSKLCVPLKSRPDAFLLYMRVHSVDKSLQALSEQQQTFHRHHLK